MFEEVDFLRREAESLLALVEPMSEADLAQPTPFKQWTVWDVIAHLHLADSWALASMDGAKTFSATVSAAISVMSRRGSLRDYAREHYAALPGRAILEAWRSGLQQLCTRLGEVDPKSRYAWFGPDMSARMFATARYMETWAHGQDVYDLLARPREYRDDIRAIVIIGLRTFGFCFRNRGLPVPPAEPYLRLTAPSGAVWEWNDPASAERIEGSAAEFCHVVTQGRNIADTRLQVSGEIARQWMAIAQCFAGPPENPPAPGSRVPKALPA